MRGLPDFAQIFGSSPDASLLVRADPPRWTIEAVTDGYLTATHKTRDELIGRATFDVFTESDETEAEGGARHVRGSFERVVANGAPVHLLAQRYDLPDPSGSGFVPRYWSLHSTAVRDAGGKVTHILHTVEDVTALVKGERALHAARERVTEVLETMSDAFVSFDREWKVTFINRAARQLHGRETADVLGKTQWELWPRSLGTDVETQFRAVMRDRTPAHFVHRYREHSAHISVEIDAYPEEETGGISVFYRDVTDKQRVLEELEAQATELEQQAEESQALAEELELANQDLQAAGVELEERAHAATLAVERAEHLLALSKALNEARTVEEVADAIFRESMATVGADAGSLALVRERLDGSVELEIVRTAGFSDSLTEQYQHFPLRAGGPLSDAIITRKPVLIQSSAAAHGLYPTIENIGFEAFAAVPVVHSGRPSAGISFSFNAQREFDEGTRTFLATLGEQCAQALERARLYDIESRRAERAAFLAEASQLLIASLDYATTLKTIAETAVPELGDWCAVDIIKNPMSATWPPTIERLAVVHHDPAMRALGLSLEQRFPTDWSAPTGMPEVLRTGEAAFIPVITDEMLAAGARDAEHLETLRKLKFTSVIIVPLVARNRTLGAITLVSSTAGKYYDKADLALAKDLAARAAFAVDNARLYRDVEDALAAAERAEAVAVAESRARSTWVATMSHEIRTPINAMLGYSDLLALGLTGPLTTEQQAQVSRIQASARVLLEIVNEVLDFAKIESGTLTVQSSHAISGEAVDEALALVRPQAELKGVTLSAQCEGARDLGYTGDQQRVRQCLVNLLSNAVKFTNSGGSISVQCRVTESPPPETSLSPGQPYIAFEVHDTGIGIAPEQRVRIFDAFTQAETTSGNPYTRERTGTGLGLAISRELAHLMGGEITVESKLGVGSTFTLWLPAINRRTSERSQDRPDDARTRGS